MASRRVLARETFTVEQANATLPLVRAIVTDLVGLSRHVVERRRTLSVLLEHHKGGSRDPYHDELMYVNRELERDNRRLQEYVAELRELGVESTNGPEGVVDFPAILNGQRVCLCWKLGEPEVRCWHEVGAGYLQRRPLVLESAARLRKAEDSL